MSAPVEHTEQKVEAIPQSTATSNWPNNISDIKTIKISNLSLAASEKDIREFFSSSGEIRHIEIKRENERTQIAYITFKESQGAETASLLTGSKIADLYVSITLAEEYQLPQEALPPPPDKKETGAVFKKAENVASTVLARGFILGKDALNRARSFDERHQLISNASATVASIDQKMGLSDKFSIGTAIVNEKVREMDVKYQVSEKAKSALAAAGPKASSAVSAVMSNPYVSSGASWMSNAFTAVSKAAGDVSLKTKEKVEQADVEKKEMSHKEKEGINEEKKEIIQKEKEGINDEKKEIVQKQKEGISDEARSRAIVPVNSADDSKPGVA